MKSTKIISSLLAVLMLVGSFTVVSAAEETTTQTPEYEYNTTNATPTLDYFTGYGVKTTKNEEKGTYETTVTDEKAITSAQTKLDSMDFRFEQDGYQLYVDEYSGEVATRCIATGEILFSNPYTIGESTATASIKSQLMSQIVVKYTDVSTGDENTYYSYEWAASRGQIVVKNIKNGIRVEYTIGREEARMLVPHYIEKSSFENNILNIMEAATKDDSAASFQFKKFKAYYTLQDPSAETSETLKNEMLKAFPITSKMAIYVLDSSTSTTEMATIEGLIKTYCPDYSYEDLDEDHLLTEYEAEDKNPPLFKMALEYTLDSQGLTVRLPANGIRFNESLYQLYSIEILPYMGAGSYTNSEYYFSYTNSGYTFFPDGSGTLFDFETITNLGASTTVTGQVYGQDYAYHTISGTNAEIIRYPVFGIVETENLSAMERSAAEAKDTNNKFKSTEALEAADTENDVYKTRGFVAIVEEGDALMELSSYHAVRTSEYNTVKMIVYPRPQDTYNVADSISVASNDTWTVVSSRKYTGNYKIRYIMLTDDTVAEANSIENYYECSYVGMAVAYREYLENKGMLTRLTAEDVEEDIPLYIEAFGAVETTKRYLSIPFTVMTPLTTFDNVKTMYDELATDGITNINFILTGFTDGGLTKPQVPYNLSWDGAVVDDMDFEDLLAYAKEKGFGLYPDFDFAYVQGNGMFDGLSLKKHIVKTIDDRYTSKREYSSTKQTYVSYFELAVSPAYFSHFYEKLTEEYLEYAPIGISVSTLGNALNSDFDEDDPYNREDSKEFTVKALEYLSENYDKVMTSAGNAYTWQYVDYITDIALDSSRYSQSYASVPFLGIVLHGYVELAGTAINMEGNIDYAVLKTIENGASLKFILSYQNTSALKNSETLSKYYSVRYDIWYDDVVEIYNEVNAALAGVQTSLVTTHKFVEGVRVPDDDELISDADEAIDAAIAAAEAGAEADRQATSDAYREARDGVEDICKKIETLSIAIAADNTSKGKYNKALDALVDFLGDYELTTAEDTVTVTYRGTENNDDGSHNLTLDNYLYNYAALVNDLASAATTYLDEWSQLFDDMATLDEYIALLETDENLTDAQLNAYKQSANNAKQYVVNEKVFAKDNVSNYASAQELIDDVVNVVKAKQTEYNTGYATYFEKVGTSEYIYTAIAEDAMFAYELVTETEPPKDADDDIETPVYESDTAKIVYMDYDNGTAFLLNFNNYKVTVEIEVDGAVRSYTLDAYGYIIVKRAN